MASVGCGCYARSKGFEQTRASRAVDEGCEMPVVDSGLRS